VKDGGGGFFWEIYKAADASLCEASSSEVAMALCNVVTGNATRCKTGASLAILPAPQAVSLPSLLHFFII
jgi:hypothetical protein